MRWKILQAVMMIESAADRRMGTGEKTNFKARWRVDNVLVKRRKVWKLRETGSGEEVVDGSWRQVL
jgi:hypothetical protein